MMNKHNRVLYIGVTSNLVKRVYQHRQRLGGFTAKYKIDKLVYFEEFIDPLSAIAREKQLKVPYMSPALPPRPVIYRVR